MQLSRRQTMVAVVSVGAGMLLMLLLPFLTAVIKLPVGAGRTQSNNRSGETDTQEQDRLKRDADLLAQEARDLQVRQLRKAGELRRKKWLEEIELRTKKRLDEVEKAINYVVLRRAIESQVKEWLEEDYAIYDRQQRETIELQVKEWLEGEDKAIYDRQPQRKVWLLLKPIIDRYPEPFRDDTSSNTFQPIWKSAIQPFHTKDTLTSGEQIALLRVLLLAIQESEGSAKEDFEKAAKLLINYLKLYGNLHDLAPQLIRPVPMPIWDPNPMSVPPSAI